MTMQNTFYPDLSVGCGKKDQITTKNHAPKSWRKLSDYRIGKGILGNRLACLAQSSHELNGADSIVLSDVVSNVL
jgi:hypothetical protein